MYSVKKTHTQNNKTCYLITVFSLKIFLGTQYVYKGVPQHGG